MLLLLLPPLLALILLASAPAGATQPPWPHGDALAAEVALHLGVLDSQLWARSAGRGEAAASSWAGLLGVRRRLLGSGFHRDLELALHSAPGGAHAAQARGCALSLLQPLPPSVFADPYQLEDLTRHAASSSSSSSSSDGSDGSSGRHRFSFQLLGPLDLELPAPACHPTALLLGFNLSSSAGSGAEARLSLPLHAKYPQPQAFGFQGWRALASGHVAAEVPAPWLLLDCRQEGGELQLLPPPQPRPDAPAADEAQGSSCPGPEGAAGDALLWPVPAGNLGHERLVSWGSLAAACLVCAVVGRRALRASAVIMT